MPSSCVPVASSASAHSSTFLRIAASVSQAYTLMRCAPNTFINRPPCVRCFHPQDLARAASTRQSCSLLAFCRLSNSQRLLLYFLHALSLKNTATVFHCHTTQPAPTRNPDWYQRFPISLIYPSVATRLFQLICSQRQQSTLVARSVDNDLRHCEFRVW